MGAVGSHVRVGRCGIGGTEGHPCVHVDLPGQGRPTSVAARGQEQPTWLSIASRAVTKTAPAAT